MVESGEISKKAGYLYANDAMEFYEFHVDEHPSFQAACNHLPFGGQLSVRKPGNQKKAMIFGQDEVIMKQFLFTSLAWTLPDGSRPLVPKDEGMGLMVSAFTSRELGFGYSLSYENLMKVNEYRKGKKYGDEKASIQLFGNSFKKELTDSPFVRKLEYGANKEGYWCYEHMVVQLEDCIDVLHVLHPDFDFIFLFDHSNGHDRLQPDGLNLNRVSVKFGGKQPKMRTSKLTSSTFFGPHHTTSSALQLGDSQTMQFSEIDIGPCYLNDKEREERRNDYDTGKVRVKDVLKSNLVKELKRRGIKDPRGNKSKLQQLAKDHNVPIKFEEKIIEEGWVGKQKLSLQILFERGWINLQQIDCYTKAGKKETDSNVFRK